MWSSRAHPPDEQLLSYADRELSPRRSAAIREHLGECKSCQARIAQLQGVLGDFVSLHEESLQSLPKFGPGSRLALKTRLANAERPASYQRLQAFTMPRQFAAACVALLIVAGSLWTMRNVSQRLQSPSVASREASGLPEKLLTPGVASAVSVENLCSNSNAENDPPLSSALEQAVFKEYGLPASSKDHYRVDYLISPSLGGTDDIQNLWPEPYALTSWDSRVKDELEDRLHALVCEGKLPLETAQKELAADWIAAYKKHFNTDTPLSNAARLFSPVRLEVVGTKGAGV